MKDCCWSKSSLIGLNQFSIPLLIRSELFMNQRVKVPSVLSAVASAFWRREFPGFSRIFHKLEVKASNCRRFPLLHPRQTWWSDCNSTCRTNSCGETSKSSYNGTVSAGRKKRGWEKRGKRKRRIACVFRSIWYFFHNAYTVDFFAVIVTCTCHPRPFSAAWTFNLHWAFVP